MFFSLVLAAGLVSAVPLDSTTSSNDAVANVLSTRDSSSQWWFPNVNLSNPDYDNYAPNLNGDTSYQVYVAVSNVSGLTNAIASNGPDNGQRYNGYLAAQPRVIYVAPGTYELTETLYMYTDTIIVGDAVNPPTISASSGFNGDTLVVGGQGSGSSGGGESKFSTVIKNVILDTTGAANAASTFTALSWRVAQNSALVNVQINLPQGSHTGISLGQGSTVQIGDSSINNGLIGVDYGSMEQCTIKNFTFTGCTTGINIDGGFNINVFAATFDTNTNPIVFQNSGEPWVSIVDAHVSNSGVFLTSHNEYPNFMIENIQVDSAKKDVVVVGNNTKVAGQTSTGTYVYGNVYSDNPIYQTNGSVVNIARPTELAPNKFYPVVSADQYPDKTVADVINLKDTTQNGGFTLKGDGSTDDGAALQGALNTAASAGKIAFLPFGVYNTTQTITIPPGTELVGNGWSTISGFGSNFTDSGNPSPVVQIGEPGSTGTAHIQDMRFTVGAPLAGAIIVQVNMAGSAPGDVSIHNSLVTIGGTPDTTINCNDPGTCQSAFLSLHLSASSSAYIDNVWNWVADHATDGSSAGINSSAKGGVLIEATKGTWLTGLASEHFWLFNVAYNNASNVFTSLFQGETNYHQGQGASVVTPAPWTPGPADPDFSFCGSNDPDCHKTLGQYWSNGTSSNLFLYGSGSWNFAQFGGDQQVLNVMESLPQNTYVYGLCGHDTDYLLQLPNGTRFGNATDGYGGSWGDLVAYDPDDSQTSPQNTSAADAAHQRAKQDDNVTPESGN